MAAAVTGTQVPFQGEHAQAYDRQAEYWQPVRDALHFTIGELLLDRPAEARVLCVGAGTGAEIAFLADRHPGWHFVAVDTSADMLEVCRTKAEAGGYADRCRFHVGPVETLADDRPFDVATAILVSQFILDRAARETFFRDIAARLRTGGDLVSVDLSTALTGDAYRDEVQFWLQIGARGGADRKFEQFEAGVSVLSPEDLCGLIERAGFTPPFPIYQCLLMRGWHARRGD